MNSLGYAILGAVLVAELFEVFLDRLNIQHAKRKAQNPPPSAAAVYADDTEKLRRAIDYASARSHLGLRRTLAVAPIFYALFLSGGLASAFTVINETFANEYVRAFVFFVGWSVVFRIIGLPFSLYETFVVEREFGFNRTTPMTFIRDMVVGGAVSLVLTVVVLTGVIAFINVTGSLWWLYAGIFIAGLSIALTIIYPTLIAPLFNRFEPLEDGELRSRIEALAERADFPLTGIYRMDASKRTSHSNAYFAGLGRAKRIVLFDTLLDAHTDDEIIAVLAHEIGHYRLGHIRTMLMTATGIILVGAFMAGLLVNQPGIYAAFGFPEATYIGLFLVTIVFTPASLVLNPALSAVSRRNEYAADSYAKNLTDHPEWMVTALVKLSGHNLSNPLPHPAYVAVHYSHPPLIERVAALGGDADTIRAAAAAS